MNPLLAIPAILLLVHRALSRKSLTPLGVIAAALTAIIHALHPSPTPFILLVAFYLAGTKATKVNHALKRRLTLSATGSEGGESQRTHVQVLANSAVASVLVLVQVFLVGTDHWNKDGGCFSFSSGRGSDLVMIGIVGCVFPTVFTVQPVNYRQVTTSLPLRTLSPPNWESSRRPRRDCSLRRICVWFRQGRTGGLRLRAFWPGWAERL